MNGLSSHFTHYLDNRSLPVSHAEVRHSDQNDVQVTLVSHLSNDGIWFDAIDDLIVSIVMRSDHSPVTRDVGAGAQSFIERPGCILITPPRTASYWSFDGNPHVLHLSVPSQHFLPLTGCESEELQGYFMNAARHPLYDKVVSQLASRMWASMEARETHTPAFGYHALGTVLSLILSSAHKSRSSALGSPAQVQPLASWRLQRVLKYMSEHIAERPAMRELAHHVGLSTDHFARAFIAVTGKSPFQWQSEMRVEEAKRMLKENNASVTEIALNLGYSSSAHFSTRFKQIVGLTPKQWKAGFSPEVVDFR